MTIDGSSFIPSFKQAFLLALGLSASTLSAAGGCAQRGGFGICVDSEVDYQICDAYDDANPPPEGTLFLQEEVCFENIEGCEPCDVDGIIGAAIDQADTQCSTLDVQAATLLCGPDPERADDECCYRVRLDGDFSCAQEGRPLLAGVESTPRLATLRVGSTWRASADAFAELCRPRAAATLRRRWLEAARYEHASVAAFARVSAQLLALGAPAALVSAAQRAAADEVRHARLCFEVAARYGEPGQAPAEPGPLQTADCVSTGVDLETTLREAIFEGAVGEGAAALAALEGAQRCEDPVIRQLLLAIAEDEQRHALLAYQTVEWALAAAPTQARAIVHACLHEGHARARDSASIDPQPTHASEDLHRHGLISPEQRATLHHESWTRLVAPILAALLARASAPRSASASSLA